MRFVPQPPIMIGGPPGCTGFGSAGESTTRWCLPANENVSPTGVFHIPLRISSCSSSISKRSPVGGNGIAYAACSPSYQPAPSPSSTRPPLIASACATWIARGPGKRNVTGVTSVPSRMRVVSRRERRERHPGVGRTRPGIALADALVVVGTEERVEAEALGAPGDREQLVVGRALLRLGEDAQSHAPRNLAAAGPAPHGPHLAAVRCGACPACSASSVCLRCETRCMVVAFSGWVDAGIAGAGAVTRAARAADRGRAVRGDRSRRPHGPATDPAERATGPTTATG